MIGFRKEVVLKGGHASLDLTSLIVFQNLFAIVLFFKIGEFLHYFIISMESLKY